MVLHTKNRFGFVAHAFDGLIIEIDAIDRNAGGQRLWIHCEALILGSDLDLARFEIFHRLIAAAMAEFQFEGLPAKSLAENLVTEANSENRQISLNQLAHSFDSIIKD